MKAKFNESYDFSELPSVLIESSKMKEELPAKRNQCTNTITPDLQLSITQCKQLHQVIKGKHLGALFLLRVVKYKLARLNPPLIKGYKHHYPHK